MINNKIKKEIINQFVNLVKIPSSSGKEKLVGKYIKKIIIKNGWQVKVDKSGLQNQSDFGNIIAFHKSKNKNRYLFVAHMDTVQKPEEIVNPKIVNGEFKSDGTTILGADNKASVAVFLTLTKYLKFFKKSSDVVFAFTTREENGIMGSKYLDIKKINPKYIFNVDGSADLGTVDFQSLGQTVFEVNILGKAAHSTSNTNIGINALVMGSKIISSLRMGKFKDGTTLNIGIMKSGTGTNIIPYHAYLKGEVRGISQSKIDKRLKTVFELISKIVKSMKGKFDLKIVESNPPFVYKKNKKIIQIVKNAMAKLSLKYVSQTAPYTSDSSYLSQNGIPTLTICKGGKNAHSFEESISISELEKLYQILLTICYDNIHD